MNRIDENHSFNIHIATALKGHVKKAILLKEIYGWVHLNRVKKKNIRHGLSWTYMTASQLSEKFPYMDGKSIARWLKDLEKNGWLYSGNFNKKAYDKTKWYTINEKRYDDAVLKNLHSNSQNEEWISQIENCITQNEESFSQNEKPIPTLKQKQTKEVDFKEQSRKALELLAIAEKLESTLIDFCTLNAPQIELMMNKALFKGDYKKQLAPFVEHNVENLFFRGSPITFFVKKFTQWLRYAKNPIRRKKGATSYNNIMSEYYAPEIREKIRTRNPERFKAYEKEFNDVVVRAEVENYLKKLKNVKNKTYTPYLIYDICFGMLADKAGTKADRRFSKFKQWYGKITDYQKNQWNLRSEFQKHITK